MKAFVLLSIRTGDVSQVLNLLSKVESVREAHMTFGPYDAIAVIEAADVNAMGKIISNEIQPIPGILETLTCLAVTIN
ncbi:MAG TPA: Lrp/AsnC ligand binding domain-containing protein [Anaerolineales bacterium]|nr:Lrp/AsnC ligand binding domain-containing protein [Anaerolineales bacterium]